MKKMNKTQNMLHKDVSNKNCLLQLFKVYLNTKYYKLSEYECTSKTNKRKNQNLILNKLSNHHVY